MLLRANAGKIACKCCSLTLKLNPTPEEIEPRKREKVIVEFKAYTDHMGVSLMVVRLKDGKAGVLPEHVKHPAFNLGRNLGLKFF
jgi:hypothetical protein